MIEKDVRECKLKNEVKKHKKEVSKEVDHESERKDMPPLEKSPINKNEFLNLTNSIVMKLLI